MHSFDHTKNKRGSRGEKPGISLQDLSDSVGFKEVMDESDPKKPTT